LNQENHKNSLLDQCEQVVIYGANGWMGRSAVDYVTSFEPTITRDKILLIGSKASNLKINGFNLDVFPPIDGLNSVRENAIFLNAAFLRREFLQEMTPEEYLHKNEEIVGLAKSAIKKKKLLSFINLSSGVARDLDQGSEWKHPDEYARLKKRLEVEYDELSSQSGNAIINCRIFSLTGRYLNEFENLALSSFIKQAKENKRIEVRSPVTKRTYVDAVSLAGTLLLVASEGKDASFDSGGTLVTMLEMAENVAAALGKDQMQIIVGKDESPDYFGDFERYNRLAADLGQNLSGINEQILNTIRAFI
jgi:nucleoside-diphosphate-sugar epimerase